MKKVRFAVIGAGSMGQHHLKHASELANTELTAVCDLKEENAIKASQQYGCKYFTDFSELLKSQIYDAVLISTPHYSHAPLAIQALDAGYNVLVEKPLSVHKADCEKVIDAYNRNKSLKFGVMFNWRTEPCYKKLKQFIDNGTLGRIFRINWIITNWFRTNHYYKTDSWRATWEGEGGGVLMNQCPHQLDLFQWLFGMPASVRAFCKFGKEHDIEVEDEVSAYMEYPDGKTAVFITSTCENPGTNRLEIAAEFGRVVLEDGKFSFIRTEQSVTDAIRNNQSGQIDKWNVDIPNLTSGGHHLEITKNFADSILNNTPLIAPGIEGINSVELANAMIYSTIQNQTVLLPLDSLAYEKCLQYLINTSITKKKST